MNSLPVKNIDLFKRILLTIVAFGFIFQIWMLLIVAAGLLSYTNAILHLYLNRRSYYPEMSDNPFWFWPSFSSFLGTVAWAACAFRFLFFPPDTGFF